MTNKRTNSSLSVSGKALDETIALAQALRHMKAPSQVKKANSGRSFLSRAIFFLLLSISFIGVQGVLFWKWRSSKEVLVSPVDFVHVALLWSLISAIFFTLYVGIGAGFMVRTKEAQTGTFSRCLAYAIVGGAIIWLLVFSYLLPPSLGWFPAFL